MRIFFSLKGNGIRTFQTVRCAVTSKRAALLFQLIPLIFALTAQQGYACTLNVTGVNFGSYDVFSNIELDTTGNIDVNCPTGIPYSIALSEGGGTHTQRVMSSGVHTLNYNLYTGANRGVVWGDATSGNVRVNGTGNGVSINYGVYGRIPALQNVHAGSYSDITNVVLTF